MIKKLTIATIALALTTTTASAGLLDMVATSDWPVKESNAFKVEAYGYDFRVYEWVSEANPNVVCSVAIGNADRAPYMGMQCFEKGEKTESKMK
jgi:hypothetical protein